VSLDATLDVLARGAPLPGSWGDPEGEERAAREGAALAGLPDRASFDVRGQEAVTFLQRLLTADVEAMPAGSGGAALLLDVKGRIVADLDLWRDAAMPIRVATAVSAIEATLSTLGRMVLRADVRLERRQGRILRLVGPGAERAWSDAGGAAIPGAPYGHVTTALAGVVLHARRLRTPSMIEIETEPAADVRPLLEALAAHATPVGRDVLEGLRVATGRPGAEGELSQEVFPQEMRLEEAVSFTKGCYLGQETVARIHYRGHVNRLLCGLALDGPAEAGTALTAGGREVGRITSVARTVRNGWIGLAILRRESSDPGTELVAGEVGARVVSVPLD